MDPARGGSKNQDPRYINVVSQRALVILIVALALGIPACSPPPPPTGADYLTRIELARRAKDEAWQKTDVPVAANRKGEFLPLVYYPVDPAYDVPAELKPSKDAVTMEMMTSTGEMRQMRRVGQLEFSVVGQPQKLTAFVEATAQDLSRLFVPFKDQTNGVESYDGGRYLDLDRTATGLYALDFNLAYTPNCHFSPTWSCPLPPRENTLPIEIKAGEKVRKKS